MHRFLIPLVAVFAAAPAAAQQTQAFHSEAAYTVQLPASWRRMPDEEVEVLRQVGAQAGMPFTLEAGYRVTNSPTGWPFIAMAWMDLGQTVTPEEFGAGVTGAAAQATMQEGADQVAEGSRVGAPTWDAENRIVWTRSKMPASAQAVSPISWTAATLHPNGSTMILFAYYAAPGEDEARIRAELLRIIRSLRAD